MNTVLKIVKDFLDDEDDSVLKTIASCVGIGYALYKTVEKVVLDYSTKFEGYDGKNKSSSSKSNDDTHRAYSQDYANKTVYYLSVLGLKPGASIEDAKRAYKELSKRFHPDVVSGKDLDYEFVQFATKRFQGIQEAYDYLKVHLC